MVNNNHPVFQQVLIEQQQAHETRKPIIKKIESLIKRPILTYFTSFNYPVMVDDSDADMLEGILQKMDLTKGLAVVVSSPGGNGLAAERILNICRSYSKTGEYWAYVPGKAKSAATMICFGASKIYMGPASELGPVDPQIAMQENGETKRFSVHNIIKSYEDLFKKATETKGNLQPFLQQLAHYDERDIQEMRSAVELSQDISVKALKSGMMSAMTEKDIKSKIHIFLTPEKTKAHGRPIYHDEAKLCSLNIEYMDHQSELSKQLHELYIRTSNYVNTRAMKCFESKDYSFSVPAR